MEEHKYIKKQAPIIALVTDYGNKDYYVAMLKADILALCGQVSFLDVSHDILPYDIAVAAYFQRCMLDSLPMGSVSVIAVNNHYDEKPTYLIYEEGSRYFIAPDNGVLSLIFDDFDSNRVLKIDTTDLPSSRNAARIYAHAVACLVHGIPIEVFTFPCDNPVIKVDFRPVASLNQLRASVIHIDNFGNAITNLTADLFKEVSEERSFRLYYNPHTPIEYICRSYANVGVGEALCLFNDAGLLEIAVNMQNAAKMLNLNVGDTIQIDFY